MIDSISGERGNTAVYAVLASREAAGKPIRVGVVGAGATGRAIALQLGTPVPGMLSSIIPSQSLSAPSHFSGEDCTNGTHALTQFVQLIMPVMQAPRRPESHALPLSGSLSSTS